ncbi:uncharacterized protein LOC111265317 [Varroa jacobsoni]|uniref:Uncharacterized protein n=1 Tax=Varroa destructor TaxID=109461 RepID=A0A7M7JDQ7_VARDE|nr:uncharacterized protein LOC111245883 [Varroa destructor]XP_022650570.1 uncharacterized protein LOC111245883 [Varroa destructor]XP_022650580.1 uncharacterized protein LOC111245883 [Varroa destructor]XP_022650589.1 uncharacterized protein LOC111245883 [Varroa destructor]XP_022650598.1 uncharacterized protein LOC111245883 [Varroa destructor]XP_022650608.1 uncharacterized protein LOC111245883 [Varroa destructor]XP_022650617.1 uncharacterized protein LOC111245883 [Varroa destructor]XP_02265062
MDYYDRSVSRARGRLIASRQAFFEQVACPQSARNGPDPNMNITNLVDEKLEKFTRSTQEATKNLAKSTPDLTALEENANIRVSQHLSKSRGNLNQTFDSSLFVPQRNSATVTELDNPGSVSASKSFSSYFTHKKPPLPPKKPSSPPPPTPVRDFSNGGNKENREPSVIGQTQANYTQTTTPLGAAVGANSINTSSCKISEFDRIVNSIKSTDTYRRYKNHPLLAQPPDMRRRSKSLGFLEFDEDDNWILPVSAKVSVEPVFPELSERSVSTTHLAKKSGSSVGAGGSSEDGGASGTTDDEDDVPIPCNRLTAAKSEYELRVEKSLKNLNLPDWYTKSSRPSSRASILSGRGTPAMSSERFIRNRPDYESFRSVHSTTSASGAPKRDISIFRTTTPSWRSFSSIRRSSPPTPNSEAEHESMEKTQNWINSQHSTISDLHHDQTAQQHRAQQQTTTRHNSSRRIPATTCASTTTMNPPYTGWRRTCEVGVSSPFETRRTKDFGSSDSTEYSSSFEEKRYGSERYSFVQAVNNSVLSEDQQSYLETSFDSSALLTSEVYHDKMWIETSLISRPVEGGFQKTDFHETTYREGNFPNNDYSDSFSVFEKREQRHPDVVYNNKEAPPRPTTHHPFSGGLLEAIV